MTVCDHGCRGGWSPSHSKGSLTNTHFGIDPELSRVERARSCSGAWVESPCRCKIPRGQPRNRGREGIEEKPIEVETMSFAGFVRAIDAVSIELTGTNPLHPNVPYVAGAVAPRSRSITRAGIASSGWSNNSSRTRLASRLKMAKLTPPPVSWVPKGRGEPALNVSALGDLRKIQSSQTRVQHSARSLHLSLIPARTMARNCSACRLAPPIKAPSTPGRLKQGGGVLRLDAAAVLDDQRLSRFLVEHLTEATPNDGVRS